MTAMPMHGRTFSGRGRGGDLKAHDAWMSTCLRESERILDVGRLSRMWTAFREPLASRYASRSASRSA